MRFTKMHGLGNDYLYVYGDAPENVSELSVKLSDRHFGAGADGMIYISESDIADFKMRMFNADGSEGKMCGNGIRCVGKYVYDRGYTEKTHLDIETASGIRHLELHIADGKVESVTVDMGIAEVSAVSRLTVQGQEVVFTPVSVGNPHAVIFTDNAEEAPVTELGPAIERHETFPDGVNVEFIQVLSENELRMRVWERGSGVTMACGTGACAAAAAAIPAGYCRYDQDIGVTLDGGTLKIRIGEHGEVLMSGPAEFVYEGETLLC